MLETLFGTFERDHVVDLIKSAHDPAPEKHRAGLAEAMERILIPYIHQFREKLYSDGRGASAVEFDATVAFADTVENTSRILRLSDDSKMDKAAAFEIASDLESAWTRFIADGAAHRMYGDYADDLRKLEKGRQSANQARQQKADADALSQLDAWQKKNRVRLFKERKPIPEKERIRKFAASENVSERVLRRLRMLMKQGKIPGL